MFGLYVHFPYCRKRCPYCDFAIHVRRRIPHEEYAEVVCRELDARASLFDGRGLVSVYFGGGTPSLWEPRCVRRVIERARAAFASSTSLEVTLEANPDDLPRATLDALREAGVNRLSVGAESFDPAQLATLGRLHGTAEIRRAAEDARAAGFDNLSFDLIYALPDQTLAHLDAELDALLALDAGHCSIYQLTVEPRTPFDHYERRGELPLPAPELCAEMAELVEARCRADGLVRYEVSSYAREGRRAVHNSLYWKGGEWLGLGSAAHSFRRVPGGGERWSTVKNVDEYMRRATRPVIPSPAADSALSGGLIAHQEPLDEETLAREAMWLGLRLLDEGVDRRAFEARFGQDPIERFGNVLGPLIEGGLVEGRGGGLRLTARGALLADEIGLRFF